MSCKRTRQWLLVAAALLQCSAHAWVSSPTSHHAQDKRPTTTTKPRSQQLNAVSVLAEPDRGLTIIPIGGSGSRGAARWPRKLVKRVFRRDHDRKLQAAFTTSDVLKEAPIATRRAPDTNNNVTSFILRDFETLTPSQVLPTELLTPRPYETSRFVAMDKALQPNKKETATHPTIPTSVDELAKASPPLARYAENTLATLVHRWTQGVHSNLQVHCDASAGGVVDLVKGLFRADATISFDRLVFGAIRMSRGKLTSHRLALNVYKFAPLLHKRIPRFAQAFDLEAHDVTFTSRDLFESNCVRHGLRRLLTRILRNRGLLSSSSKVDITSIQILPNGKLAIQGSATPTTLLQAAKVDFEVRSGLGTDRRGHVLTFPGLEISVSPAVGLFVPVVPPLSLDMGHNFSIRKVHLNGRDGTLQLSCRTTITPRHTRKLREGQYKQSTNSFAASFHFDVGRWLTRIGNFSD